MSTLTNTLVFFGSIILLGGYVFMLIFTGYEARIANKRHRKGMSAFLRLLELIRFGSTTEELEYIIDMIDDFEMTHQKVICPETMTAWVGELHSALASRKRELVGSEIIYRAFRAGQV